MLCCGCKASLHVYLIFVCIYFSIYSFMYKNIHIKTCVCECFLAEKSNSSIITCLCVCVTCLVLDKRGLLLSRV